MSRLEATLHSSATLRQDALAAPSSNTLIGCAHQWQTFSIYTAGSLIINNYYWIRNTGTGQETQPDIYGEMGKKGRIRRMLLLLLLLVLLLLDYGATICTMCVCSEAPNHFRSSILLIACYKVNSIIDACYDRSAPLFLEFFSSIWEVIACLNRKSD